MELDDVHNDDIPWVSPRPHPLLLATAPLHGQATNVMVPLNRSYVRQIMVNLFYVTWSLTKINFKQFIALTFRSPRGQISHWSIAQGVPRAVCGRVCESFSSPALYDECPLMSVYSIALGWDSITVTVPSACTYYFNINELYLRGNERWHEMGTSKNHRYQTLFWQLPNNPVLRISEITWHHLAHTLD